MPPGFRQKAAERLRLQPGDRVLEIGCGTGRNLPPLRAAVGPTGSIYGVDISAGMLATGARAVRAAADGPTSICSSRTPPNSSRPSRSTA